MRFLLFSWFAVVSLQCILVACQQDLPLWSGQAIPKELLRPYFLDATSSVESPDYDSSQKSQAYPAVRQTNGLKKRVGELALVLPLVEQKIIRIVNLNCCYAVLLISSLSMFTSFNPFESKHMYPPYVLFDPNGANRSRSSVIHKYTSLWIHPMQVFLYK